jgi:DUF971 family protein
MSQAVPLPTRLRKEGDDRLVIEWSDGRTGYVTWADLRLHCPCAGCREEREKPPDPFRVLKDHEIPRGPLKPIAMTPVGYYAYKIVWNDGHDTGIFTLESLRALCHFDESHKEGPMP